MPMNALPQTLRHSLALVTLVLAALGVTLPAAAEEYVSKQAFLSAAFGSDIPRPQTLWLNEEHKAVAKDILHHPYQGIRVRYWQQGATSAWIMEEIGRERPIRIGVVLDADRIREVTILQFLESRGWEVKHDFFTDQFKGAVLDDQQQLTTHIDGITGATLSVRAVTKVSRWVLYLAGTLDTATTTANLTGSVN